MHVMARLTVVAGVVAALGACGTSSDAVPTTGAAGQASSTTSIQPREPAQTEPTPGSAPAPSSSVRDTEPTTTTTAATTTTLAPLLGLAYELVADGLEFPILALSAPGDDRLFIATKEGRVWIHDGTAIGDTPFLDIREPVRNDREQGLLGMAFHPDYPADGRFFVHYTAGDGDTVVAEFRVDPADPNRALPEGVELYRTGQPARNHNGGMLEFGPDGYLYLGLGDGGGANDRFGHGQRTDTPLAALLRFDVSTPGTQRPAPDPPFPAGDPLVWHYGLRNPWRFAIDNDLIYIADVGQNRFEEVSVALIATGGLNFGWPVTEGAHCFRPSSGCDTAGLTLPVVEVAHGDAGTCSITGGLVYRGSAIPELDGHYFYSDFCGGWLRSFHYNGGAATDQTDWTAQVGGLSGVTSFGRDAAGELYVTTAGGSVHRIVPVR